jgi:hypothetical protein
MDEGEIAIDRDAFDLARNASDFLDISNDAVGSVRKERIVLDVGPAHQTRLQIGLPLVEDLFVNGIEHLQDVGSIHDCVLMNQAAPLMTNIGR